MRVRYGQFAGIDQPWIDDAAPVRVPAPGSVVLSVQASCITPGSLSALGEAHYVRVRDVAGTIVVADPEAKTRSNHWRQLSGCGLLTYGRPRGRRSHDV